MVYSALEGAFRLSGGALARASIRDLLEPNWVMALLRLLTWVEIVARSDSTVAASRLTGDADTERMRTRAAKLAENFMARTE